MDPAHRNEPDAAPGAGSAEGTLNAPQPRRWRIGTPLVVLLSGALFAVSAINSEGTDLRPGRYTDLASLTEAESKSYQALQAEAIELKTEVDRLTSDVDDARVREEERKAARLRPAAGLEKVSGAGVTVVLSDADEEILLDAIDEVGGDPSQIDTTPYVVHQQDIQAVVNALWAGGARAVTIAGQRVVSTTGIKCTGSAVQLQGVPYPQPYTIQAVGVTDDLIASLDADSDVAGFRADADRPSIGVGWQLDEEDDVEAPAFTGLIDIDQAKPQRG